MTKEELVKLQTVQYEILKDVVKICKKHHIQYYLAYGTLLGAIRHKGTIPWDYDIDIWMDYDNHQHFMEVSHEIGNNYEVSHLGSGKNYYTGLSRVYKKDSLIYTENHGKEGAFPIHIDIFILEYAKEYSLPLRKIVNSLCRYLSLVKLSKYERGWLFERFKKQPLKLLTVKSAGVIHQILKEETVEKWIHAMLVSKNSTSEYIVLQEIDKRIPVKCFDFACEERYEDALYSIPNESEEILRLQYGDYMTPPPEDKRFTSDMDKWKICF